MGQFDGYFESDEVRLGTIYGMRTWEVESNGTLVPCSGGVYTYKNGENVAGCIMTDIAKMRPRHRPAEKYCTCGFYAYYDGSNYYGRGGTNHVTGIIEAYGKCQVGSAGFRAEKCRIVALVIPGHHAEEAEEDHHYPWCKPAKWVGRSYDRDATFGIGGLGAAIIGLIFTVLGGTIWGPWVLYPALAVMYGGFCCYLLAAHALQHHMFTPGYDDGRLSKVPKRYPDAEIFQSEAEMRKKYPLGRPEKPESELERRRKMRWFKNYTKEGKDKPESEYDPYE